MFIKKQHVKEDTTTFIHAIHCSMCCTVFGLLWFLFLAWRSVQAGESYYLHSEAVQPRPRLTTSMRTRLP